MMAGSTWSVGKDISFELLLRNLDNGCLDSSADADAYTAAPQSLSMTSVEKIERLWVPYNMRVRGPRWYVASR
jgi:hypothetical protein